MFVVAPVQAGAATSELSPSEAVALLRQKGCPFRQLWKQLGLEPREGFFGSEGCAVELQEYDDVSCASLELTQADDYQVMVFCPADASGSWDFLGAIALPRNRFPPSPHMVRIGTRSWLAINLFGGGGTGASRRYEVWVDLSEGLPEVLRYQKSAHIAGWSSLDREFSTTVDSGFVSGVPWVNITVSAKYETNPSSGVEQVLFERQKRVQLVWSGSSFEADAGSELSLSEVERLFTESNEEVLERFHDEFFELAREEDPERRKWLNAFLKGLEPGPWSALLREALATGPGQGTSGEHRSPGHHAEIRHIAASSTVQGAGEYSFRVQNLLDGDLTTSWQPASKQGGVGEWVMVLFPAEVDLEGVEVANGFQRQDRFGDEFLLNNRVEVARLVFSDGSEEVLRFGADQRGMIEFPFALRRVEWVKLVVDSVHPGSKWQDLAVSELAFRVRQPEEPEGVATADVPPSANAPPSVSANAAPSVGAVDARPSVSEAWRTRYGSFPFADFLWLVGTYAALLLGLALVLERTRRPGVAWRWVEGLACVVFAVLCGVVWGVRLWEGGFLLRIDAVLALVLGVQSMLLHQFLRLRMAARWAGHVLAFVLMSVPLTGVMLIVLTLLAVAWPALQPG